MLETACKVNLFLLRYAQGLMQDIPDERLAEQPHGVVNHPAWILGHLTVTAESVGARLGGTKVLPESWGPLFSPGSKPTSTRATYPAKEDLMRALEESYRLLRDRAVSATPEQLAQPTTSPRAKDLLPTAREMTAFILTGHVGIHLGQLSTWRRLIGLPPLF